MNKGIIIIGSVGSGKSHFEEELCRWTDFQEPEMYNRLDPDDWVENEISEFEKSKKLVKNEMCSDLIGVYMTLKTIPVVDRYGFLKGIEKIRSDNNLKDGEKIKIKNLKDKYLKLLYLSRNYHSRINLIMKLKYELEELFASSSSCFSEKDRSLKIDISCLMRDVEQKV
jgi:hypothetical protein